MIANAPITLDDYLAIAGAVDAADAAAEEHRKAEDARQLADQFTELRKRIVEIMPELAPWAARWPTEEESESGYYADRPRMVFERTFDEEPLEAHIGVNISGSVLTLVTLHKTDYGADWRQARYGGVYADDPPENRRAALALAIRDCMREARRAELAIADPNAPIPEPPAAPTHTHDWRARLARYCGLCNTTELEEWGDV